LYTTLKGTAGSLDLADVGGSWTVANIEGSPSVTNGDLTVTGIWAVDTATIGTAPVNVSGTLTFGADATISVVPVLIYDGHLSKRVPADGYFGRIISARELLGLPD